MNNEEQIKNQKKIEDLAAKFGWFKCNRDFCMCGWFNTKTNERMSQQEFEDWYNKIPEEERY